ncbi:MAG: 4Fe-4S ferredoxin [Desulfonatronovibrio sp. MSAO_Bac4]|nr:MAG: 4Fe-4S ferredoxin [Desulfonatronovibrio sp. MSAO_Bac4]
MKKIVKPSTWSFFTEKSDNKNITFFTRLHGYIYGRWPYLYIGIGTGRHPLTNVIKPLWSFLTRRSSKIRDKKKAKIKFANEYHGKVLPAGEATKLVKVNKSIDIGDLEQVVPYTKARDIILKNPDHIAVLDCPCRATRDNPCLPIDVCLIIGEPFASFILEHHPSRSRRIFSDEAVSIIEQEHKRGHVQHAFFKEAMLGRFYAICNCCTCCCGAIKAHRNGVPMLASSGFTAEIIDFDNCEGCGACSKSCQFRAISMKKDHPRIHKNLCMGCGVCVDKCRNSCLSLALDPDKCPPLDISQAISKTKALQTTRGMTGL